MRARGSHGLGVHSRRAGGRRQPFLPSWARRAVLLLFSIGDAISKVNELNLLIVLQLL